MTTLPDLIKALADQPEPPPRRPMFVAYPTHVADAEMLGYLRGLQQHGFDVIVMEAANIAAVSLDDWLNRGAEVCCDCHSRPEDIEAHLARWSAEYGMTQAGVPLPPPPEGWALVPFGAEVPAVHREFIEGGGWAFPRQCRSTITPLFARPAGPTRAYARPKP